MKQLLTISFLFIGSFIYSQQLVINEIMSANSTTHTDEDGDYSDWVELYNPSPSSVNLENYRFSDNLFETDQWYFPSVSIPPNGFLIVFLSGKDRATIGNELHTNFKLKAAGENLVLSNNQATVVDHFQPVSLNKDYSYGRLPDGSNDIGFLTESSPQTTNSTSDFIRFIDFSHPQGFYPSPFDLEMTCTDSIFYTLDGSTPTPQSTLFESSINMDLNAGNKISLIPTTPDVTFSAPQHNVNHGIVVRAQPYHNGVPSGPIHNRTYFIQEHDFTFDVLSVVIDSLSLFDQDSGIYVPGVHFDSLNPIWSGNYYQRGIDWERPCSVSLFDASGNEAFSHDMGVRISGNGSRRLAQKSLRFYLREEYGKSSITYPLFPKRKNHEIKRFVARSSFTSWYSNSLFKDEIIQEIAYLNKMNLDVQMARPTIVYINGEYWGIHTLKERQDEHYLNAIYGIDKDSLDILDGNLSVNVGSATDFEDLLDFIELNDLSNPDNYEYVEERIDVDNFIDYYILETYFGNMDWPKNNMRLWRPQTAGGKWRFLLYDLDATIGKVYQDPFERLDTILNDQSFLFKNLLLSKSFKDEFICRYHYHLETTFHPYLMNAFTYKLGEKYAPEMPQHIARWSYPNSLEEWSASCEHLNSFSDARAYHIKSHLIDYFNVYEYEDFNCPSLGTSGISIFPNPAEDQTYLKMNNLELIGGTISIYDAKGTLINESPVEYMTQHLPVANLQSGLYIVHVRKGDILRTTKLLMK